MRSSLKQKHNLHNLALYHLNLEETASLERTFDLIVSSGVLHHLPNPGAGLRALREVLKPHGVMSLMLYGYYPASASKCCRRHSVCSACSRTRPGSSW